VSQIIKNKKLIKFQILFQSNMFLAYILKRYMYWVLVKRLFRPTSVGFFYFRTFHFYFLSYISFLLLPILWLVTTILFFC